MPIEALLWTLLIILSPPLVSRFRPALQSRLDELPVDLSALAPWIHSIGLPYLALILGSVSSRKMGLQGIQLSTWFIGLSACAMGLIAAWVVLTRSPWRGEPEREPKIILWEETRWGFYRGAATLWLTGPLALGVGLGLAILDLGVAHLSETWPMAPPPSTWKALLRAVLSTGLFAATGNFWLTAGTQIALASLMTRTNRQPPPRS